MFGFSKRERLEKLAARYLAVYPEDDAAVRAILTTKEMFGDAISSPRQVAEILVGRPLTDDEWAESAADRWERAWNYLLSSN